MKILLINKFQYRRGGSETYHFALAEALEKKGHEVIFFAMQDEKNIPTGQDEFFVSNVDFNKSSGVSGKLKAGLRIFYNHEAADKMEQLIEKEHPDVAHIGLIHRQLTFSIVDVLKKHGIPVVMTMHDLIFTCPNYTMLTGGEVCEDCLGKNPISCVRKKCVKNSLGASALGALENRYLAWGHFYDKIDLYIAECNQYKELMEKSGFTKSRIIKMTNFLPINQEYGFNESYGDYILYFGRFSREKGILTLLKAQEEMGCKYPLKVVGAGPMEEEIRQFVSEHDLKNVDLPGAIYGEDMERIIEGARMIILPSEWYENCPYALLQSLAKGKVTIVSRTGGLPEVVEDGRTGFTFTPGSAEELADKIQAVYDMSADDYRNMSQTIAEEARKNLYWESYIDRLLGEYEKLIHKG